jgi:hypothetical protein
MPTRAMTITARTIKFLFNPHYLLLAGHLVYEILGLEYVIRDGNPSRPWPLLS